MKRKTFKQREAQASQAGFHLERDLLEGHPYCLWFNSPSGSKEIWIRNLTDEFEQAFNELKNIKESEAVKS